MILWKKKKRTFEYDAGLKRYDLTNYTAKYPYTEAWTNTHYHVNRPKTNIVGARDNNIIASAETQQYSIRGLISRYLRAP